MTEQPDQRLVPRSDEQQLLPMPPDAEVWQTDNRINVNLDGWSEDEKSAFRRKATEVSGMPFFEGHIEHGYSLEYVRDAEHCPRCHSATKQQYSNIFYATQDGARVLLVPAGRFCTQCPTMIVDMEIFHDAVSSGYQFRGIAGVDYEGKKRPDFLKTWNDEPTTFILEDDETLVGVVTKSMLDRGSPTVLPLQQDSRKRGEKDKKRRQIAKQSRMRNRRK